MMYFLLENHCVYFLNLTYMVLGRNLSVYCAEALPPLDMENTFHPKLRKFKATWQHIIDPLLVRAPTL